MALNIKDPETERLAAEIAALTGESKTGAIRTALRERKQRLSGETPEQKRARFKRFMETEIWPTVPSGVRGKPIPQEEQDDLLGYGPLGV